MTDRCAVCSVHPECPDGSAACLVDDLRAVVSCSCETSAEYRRLDPSCPVHGTAAEAARRRGGRLPVFECRQIRQASFKPLGPSYFTTDEADAVAWATANLTIAHEQISIEVCAPGDVSTFAIRHVNHDGDSGWSCWRDGDFVGPMSIRRLFDRPIPVGE